MPENVKINKELGIIEVNSFGEVSKDDIVSSLVSVDKISIETEISKVLVDTREVTSFPKTLEIFGVAESKVPRGIKFAVIVGDAETPRFFETVARNRGFQMQNFRTKDEALKWLLSWGKEWIGVGDVHEFISW